MLSPLGESKRLSSPKRNRSNHSRNNNNSKAQSSSKHGVVEGLTPLTFPPLSGPIDPIPHLKPLRDSTSFHAAVEQSCFHLNLYAGTDSVSATDDVPSGPRYSAVFHDASYAETTSTILTALQDCAQNHEDRRCRILACQTLAQVGRSAYARIRHSPLLFTVRDGGGTLSQVEDEVGTDVAVTLANVALEDDDCVVSANAVESLGVLVLSSVSTVGSIVEDELLREMQAIVNSWQSPCYAPSIVALSDHDMAVPMSELQIRVYENTMLPRLFRLISRVSCYESSHQCTKTLPFLTACLIHAIKTNTSTTLGLDRASYAKRWMEFDAAGTVHEFVYNILLPTMQSSLDGPSAYEAAFCGIRLAHACPNASWMLEVCQFAIDVLAEQLVGTSVAPELKSHTAAALLIALRALVVSKRVGYLELVADVVQNLPPTTAASVGSSSPGVAHEYQDVLYHHRPARIGFLAEIALSLFVDGPEDYTMSHERSKAVTLFLMSPIVNSMLTSRSSKAKNDDSCSDANAFDGFVDAHVGEELVLAFCMVASEMGRCVMISNRQASSPRHGQATQQKLGEWLRCSLTVLKSFSSCLNWRSTRTDGDSTLLNDPPTTYSVRFAAQASYLCLFQECAYTAGLVAPGSSVSFNLVTRATLPGALLLEQLGEATLSLLNFLPIPTFDFALEHLITLADQFLEYKLREGLPSRHLRIVLLALLSDHWVQQLCNASLPTSNNFTNGSDASHGSSNLNVLNAREILANLSTEINWLQNDMHTDENVHNGGDAGDRIKSKESIRQYVLICVACIENIALAACDCKRRYGGPEPPNSSPRRDSMIQDVVEDSEYLVSLAEAALRGRNVRDDDLEGRKFTKEDDVEISHMLPECEEALYRIQSTVEEDAPVDDDVSWGVAGQPSLFSILLMDTEIDNWSNSGTTGSKKRIELAPLISDGVERPSRKESQILTGDAYRNAFLAQHCQQAVLSRIDMSLLTSSEADRFGDASFNRLGEAVSVRTRPRNWLRLSIPPLPPSRFVHKVVNVGTRLCWSGATSTVSACSDPISVTVAHAVRRYPQSDGETDNKLTISIRLYNVTPVEVPRGVRMTLRVLHNMIKHDDQTEHIIEAMKAVSLTEQSERLDSTATDEDPLIAPASVIFKHDIKTGESLTWEVALDKLPSNGTIVLHPSVIFREMEVEQFSTKLIGPPTAFNAEGETEGTKDDNGEDDEFVAADDFDNDEGEEYEDVMLEGVQLTLSPFVVLQPCPLVFFRDGCGDVNAFRFLWFNMPYRIPLLTLRGTESTEPEVGATVDELGQAVARLSLMHGDLGTNTKGWAFMSFRSKRVLCIMSGDDINTSRDETNADKQCRLEARSDDKSLLQALFGSRSARTAVISPLTSNDWCFEELETL